MRRAWLSTGLGAVAGAAIQSAALAGPAIATDWFEFDLDAGNLL